MTPIGHFSIISETESNPSIVTMFMTLQGTEPFSVRRMQQLWKERGIMERFPRFQSVANKDWPGYFERESLGENNSGIVEKHITETLYPVGDYRSEIRHRIQELQSTRFDLSETLWHMWVAPWGDRNRKDDLPMAHSAYAGTGESLLIFRSHHVLADGASMGAVLIEFFDEAQELKHIITKELKRRGAKAKSFLDRLKGRLLRVLWLAGGSIQAVAYQLKLLMLHIMHADPWKVLHAIYCKTYVKTEQRTISWAGEVATVDQVKYVATQLGGPNCTVNDIFVSCVAAAVTKQLDSHSRNHIRDGVCLPEQKNMHITIPVHLSGGVLLPGQQLGNNLGAFVARLPATTEIDSVSRLLAVHDELNYLKRTPAAFVSFLLAKSLSYSAYILPQTLTSWVFRRASAGSSAVVTNVRMPPKACHIDGRLVKETFAFIPLPPGVPIGVVVSSYAGSISLTLTAEPWAVPDGDQFLSFVLEEYLTLLEMAKLKVS
jgi:hypothetical protein